MIPTGQVDLDTATAIRIAALSGVGVAYLMKCIVQEELDRGELIQILPDLELETMPFQAVHAFGRMPTYRLRLFSDFIETEMQKHASR
jgi:DNA-binding transcriptional LysR family regulator